MYLEARLFLSNEMTFPISGEDIDAQRQVRIQRTLSVRLSSSADRVLPKGILKRLQQRLRHAASLSCFEVKHLLVESFLL